MSQNFDEKIRLKNPQGENLKIQKKRIIVVSVSLIKENDQNLKLLTMSSQKKNSF